MKTSCRGYRWPAIPVLAVVLCGCMPASNQRETPAPPPFIAIPVAGSPQTDLAAADPVIDATSLQDWMLAGKAEARSCIEQIDHDLDEFLDCIRVRAQAAPNRAPAQARRDDAHRLGVLTWGWYTAWIHEAYAVAGAETATLTLMRALLPLQDRLAVNDAQLCGLIDAPCALVAEARRDTLARLPERAP